MLAAELPVTGTPAELDELLELEEPLVVGVAVAELPELELEEPLVVGVAVGVEVAELLELEEPLVVGVAVGVEVAELLELEEPLGVDVAAELPELELELEVPPVTGTPEPAILLPLLAILALKPIAASLSRKPCIICNQVAKSCRADAEGRLFEPLLLLVDDELLLDELLLDEPLLLLLFPLLLLVFMPWPATMASACLRAKAYWLRYCWALAGSEVRAKFAASKRALLNQARAKFSSRT